MSEKTETDTRLAEGGVMGLIALGIATMTARDQGFYNHTVGPVLID
jgi:hypothetical protein